MKDTHEYGKIAETLFVATLFALVNILMRPAKTKAFLYVVEVFVSISFATLMGVLAAEWVSEPVCFAITAAAALLARVFIIFTIGFGDFVADRRELLFTKLLEYILNRGK